MTLRLFVLALLVSGCRAELWQEVEPPPLPSRSLPAAWMVIALVVAVAVFEIWALTHDKFTISQMIQKLARGRTWFKVLGVAAMGMLTWHIIFGGPW